MLKVPPVEGATVNQLAVARGVIVNGTVVAGLLLMVNVCCTGDPATRPFRKIVGALTVSEFCACKVAAVLDSINAKSWGKTVP